MDDTQMFFSIEKKQPFLSVLIFDKILIVVVFEGNIEYIQIASKSTNSMDGTVFTMK